MRKLGHVPALDGLRGVAILLVLISHAGYLSTGALGVDLFFVLSGFLITSLLLNEWSATASVSLTAFYRRRALRLLPALMTLLTTFLVVGSLYWDRRAVITTVTLGIGYVTNVARGLGGPLPAPGLDHLWSLATEEQFYLLWPPVLLVLLRVRVRPVRIALALGVLVVAGALWRATLAALGHDFNRLWYMPDTHLDPILLGCAAGVVFTYGMVGRIPRSAVLAALVLATTVLAAFRGDEFWMGVLGLPLFVVSATVLVLACTLERDSRLSRLLSQRALCYLGRISYGIYLWHWPLFGILGWRIGLPVSVVVAALSYRYVELPFLRRKRQNASEVVPPARTAPRPALA